jgi:hypothetical protein
MVWIIHSFHFFSFITFLNMKLLTLSFTLVFATIFSLSAQVNIPQPTHTVFKTAENPSATLENFAENFSYYDNNGNTYQTQSNNWEAGAWVLANREYYTLNAQGMKTEILRRDWDLATSTLVDAYRFTFGYHPNGQENYRKEESWNTANGLWETQQITATTFASNDKPQEITNEYYTDGLVTFGLRDIYSYDGTDRISEIINQTLDNSIWTNSEITDYVYNGPDEDFEESHSRLWDVITASWGDVVDQEKQSVTDTQRIILTEIRDSTTFIPSSRTTIDYDVNGQATDYLFEDWNDSTATWKVNRKLEYTFNNDLSISQFKFYITDFETDIFYLSLVSDSDYGIYSVSTKTPALQAKVSILPNPTADFVRVNVEGDGISNITLLDLRGNVLVRTTTAANTANLSLARQPAGVYLLRIEQNGAVKVLPVTKN